MIRFYSLFEPFRKAFSFCINKINNNNALALLIIFLCTIFIKLYFIQLGTITTDEGYYLSYSLNLKEALFYTPRDYNFYYTALVGHFFLKMFSAKLLGLRILQILNYLFLFYIIFKFLNKKIPNICIVLGTIFSLLTICSIRPLSFYYDDLSVTLCILSMYLKYQEDENTAADRKENVSELLNAIADFETKNVGASLETFLQEVRTLCTQYYWDIRCYHQVT